MITRRRAYAMILCVGLLLALFVSSVYIVQSAGHCCASVKCRVCQNVARMVKLLTGCSLLAAILWTMHIALSVWQAHSRAWGGILPGRCTLVSWKIRLNN